jgi:hypothetical protein
MQVHTQDDTPPATARPAAGWLDPAVLARGNINPQTGLATDFLNHFNEVIMLLEMLPGAPEFVDDILNWQPLNYHDYFVTSHFKDRELAILAYGAADPVARASLEQFADTMNSYLLATLERLRSELTPEAAADLGIEAAIWLKPVVARAGAVINGQQEASFELADEGAAQVLVDALFENFTP